MEQETKEASETKDDLEKNQKKDFYTEIVLMLVLGILIGLAAKTEAGKRITIGSEDYKIKPPAGAYNLNKLEKELAQSREDAQKAEAENLQTTPIDETVRAAD
ncbi:MAG: hypothetical protein COS71_01120 [Candidatus Moranbacteria bacterium CG06_land_8_20_14_3_00_40_12]|nr:MAG: hypothetical protein COX31_00190 [Candidatus Moranbacteria bacterium CG23_combo_of_CG06-09_8_20_14_all_40_16]PIU80876.1 MAG: hypothetical protein COS71_01120 [Candidatus Moranbacteria bacterium CG06_land_8_20_14_3_00_40_12]